MDELFFCCRCAAFALLIFRNASLQCIFAEFSEISAVVRVSRRTSPSPSSWWHIRLGLIEFSVCSTFSMQHYSTLCIMWRHGQRMLLVYSGKGSTFALSAAVAQLTSISLSCHLLLLETAPLPSALSGRNGQQCNLTRFYAQTHRNAKCKQSGTSERESDAVWRVVHEMVIRRP